MTIMEQLNELDLSGTDVIMVGMFSSRLLISGYYSGTLRCYDFDMSTPLWRITEHYQQSLVTIAEGDEQKIKPIIKSLMPDSFPTNKVRDALIEKYPFLND